MYTTDTTKAQVCWRCRKCGFTTPLGQETCSNPGCRADLGIFGEQFTPGVQQEPVREEKKVDPPQYDSKHQSSSNLWEESPKQKEPKKKAETEHKQTQKASRSEKKALKKQQAEARVQERSASQNGYERSKAKTFFVSVLVILVSLGVGAAFALIPVFFFLDWEYSYWIFPNYEAIPAAILIILSVLFTRFAVHNKEDRKLLYTSIAFWIVPVAISCWRRFFLNGGDTDEVLVVYLFLLFLAEPVLVGSSFAGVKGLKRTSSFLRWLSIILLVISGILALVLTINTYFAYIL